MVYLFNEKHPKLYYLSEEYAVPDKSYQFPPLVICISCSQIL